MKSSLRFLTLNMMTLFSLSAFAELNWKPYSEDTLNEANKAGKTVILGFHKKGCTSCSVQETTLEKLGVGKQSNVALLKVERSDRTQAQVYEKFGFQNKWSALVLLKNGKEVARVNPGITDENQIQALVSAIN